MIRKFKLPDYLDTGMLKRMSLTLNSGFACRISICPYTEVLGALPLQVFYKCLLPAALFHFQDSP